MRCPRQTGIKLGKHISENRDHINIEDHHGKRHKEQHKRWITEIESGDTLLKTATKTRLFTPLVLQMIAVGEETGQVDELLKESADFYEREVDYDLKSMTAKMEPLLITLVGIMIAILAFGIFTPMWSIMSAIKGG